MSNPYTEKSKENIPEIQALQAEIEMLKAENEKLRAKNDNLAEILAKLQKNMFGRKTEQLKYIDGGEQLSLFNEAEQESSSGAPEPTEETLVSAHTRKPKRTKEELTKDLEHVEQICDLEDKTCPDCGNEMVCIGKEFVRSELNIIPAQIFVIDIYRKVYKCENCADDELTPIVKAPTPVPVMKKSMASPTTAAYVIQQKYWLSVPLYRQAAYWHDVGVELNRNTLANWVIRSSLWFEPLWKRMKAVLLKEDIIHADETPVRVLKRDGTPTNKDSRMWVFCSGKTSTHKMSLYFYHPTRSGKVVTAVLGNYAGYLQTDGYSAYNAAEKAVRVGCWAHARRKWTDCLSGGIDSKNSKAKQALELIEKIFSTDKGFEGVPFDEITANREHKLEPLFDEYEKLLISIVPGSENVRKAAEYSLNQMEKLRNVAKDGRLELTNNRAERAVKPFVIGRKNWLFSDTSKGAEASARCYSIVESAELNGLKTFEYLTYLLTELPKLGKTPMDE